MDSNFATLTSLEWNERRTPGLTWTREADKAVATFGDSADAAIFMHRLYVAGAIQEDLRREGLEINFEDPVKLPGIVPTTVKIPLEILKADGLGRFSQPRLQQQAETSHTTGAQLEAHAA